MKEEQDKTVKITLKARTKLNRVRLDYTFANNSMTLEAMEKCYRKHNKLKK